MKVLRPVPYEHLFQSTRARSRRVPVYVLAVLALLVAAWLVTSVLLPIPVTVVSASAHVVSRDQPAAIVSGIDSRITGVFVRLGDTVAKGDPILTFDSQEAEIELERIDAQIAAEERRQRILEEQVRLLERIAEKEAETVSLDRERETERQRGIVSQREEARLREAALRELASRGTEAELALASASARAAELDARASQSEIDYEALSTLGERRALDIARSIAEISDALVSTASELSALSASRQAIAVELEETRVRAPIGGRVSFVADIAQGQRVVAEHHLLTIRADDVLLLRASFAAAEAAGRVVEGQTARIRFDAFPWTQYGSLSGTVVNVGGVDGDGRLVVELRVAAGQDSPIVLTDGMTADVLIDIDRSTIAQHLLGRIAPKAAARL